MTAFFVDHPNEIWAKPEPKLTQKEQPERFKQTARHTYEVLGTLKDLGIAARDAETGGEGLHLDRWLIVENHVQQGTVHFQAATVVVNEAQFTKSVHEEAHARARRADHLRERLLADIRNHRLRSSFLAKVRQQKQHPGEAFLARIEQLIDQVLFDPDGPSQKMRDEHFGKRRLVMDHADNGRFFEPHE